MFLRILTLLLLISGAAHAAEDHLYTGRSIVTGMMEENRARGIIAAFRDVLVKVSGDPRLLNDAKAQAIASDGVNYVDSYSYRDLLEGIPIHDEQGTRDRPFELTVVFGKYPVDLALASLGRKPWLGKRPRLVMALAVRLNETRYLLSSDGTHGLTQRESLEAVSWQIGMPVIVPDQAALDRVGITLDTVMQADAQSLVTAAGGDLAITGTLEWSQGTLGWRATWRFSAEGQVHSWSIKDVNFDDAFRSALRGVAQILSSNGAPP
jgi:uncharacterized protein